MHEVGLVQLTHKGQCYRNSKHGPAVAFEHMSVDAAEALFFKMDGKILGEEEACFIDQWITDGDTRRYKKY